MCELHVLFAAEFARTSQLLKQDLWWRLPLTHRSFVLQTLLPSRYLPPSGWTADEWDEFKVILAPRTHEGLRDVCLFKAGSRAQLLNFPRYDYRPTTDLLQRLRNSDHRYLITDADLDLMVASSEFQLGYGFDFTREDETLERPTTLPAAYKSSVSEEKLQSQPTSKLQATNAVSLQNVEPSQELQENMKIRIIESENTAPGYIRLRMHAGRNMDFEKEPHYIPSLETQQNVQRALTKEESGALSSDRVVSLQKETGLSIKAADMVKNLMSKLPAVLRFEGDVSSEVRGPSNMATATYNIKTDLAKYAVRGSVELDFVSCFPFRWPKEASDWPIRHRPSAWPSTVTIQRVVSGGCHIVPKAHPLSERPDIEWRFSFSWAESRLSWTLSDTHRQCYQLFKLAVTETLGQCSLLSSYHLKTVLFWTCEQIPAEYWHEENIAYCYLALINKLIHCLARCEIQNYFIPENNMIDHIPRDMLLEVCKKICQLRHRPLEPHLFFHSRFAVSPPLGHDWDDVLQPVLHHSDADNSDVADECSMIVCQNEVLVTLMGLCIKQMHAYRRLASKHHSFRHNQTPYQDLAAYADSYAQRKSKLLGVEIPPTYILLGWVCALPLPILVQLFRHLPKTGGLAACQKFESRLKKLGDECLSREKTDPYFQHSSTLCEQLQHVCLEFVITAFEAFILYWPEFDDIVYVELMKLYHAALCISANTPEEKSNYKVKLDVTVRRSLPIVESKSPNLRTPVDESTIINTAELATFGYSCFLSYAGQERDSEMVLLGDPANLPQDLFMFNPSHNIQDLLRCIQT